MVAPFQLDPTDLDALLAMDAGQRLGAIIRMNAIHRYSSPLDALSLLRWLEEQSAEENPCPVAVVSGMPSSEAGIPVSSASTEQSSVSRVTFAPNRKKQ